MKDSLNSLDSAVNKSIHHHPAEWVDFGYSPIESLGRVTGKRQRQWRRLFESHHRPVVGPFCGPDVWIPWFFANPHCSPAIFEKYDAAGNLRAMLPLFWNGKSFAAACTSEFPYQELTGKSVEAGVDLMLDVLKVCEERQVSLTLAKVVDTSLLSDVLQHPSIIEKSEVIGQLVSIVSSHSFPLTATGKREMDSAYPVHSDPRDIQHFSGREITGRLLSEIAYHHRNSKCDNRYFEKANLEHFLNLLSTNTESLVVSTQRSGGEIESYLIGYFDSNTYDTLSLCHVSRKHSDLLHHTFRHFYTKTEGPVFRVTKTGTAPNGESRQVSSYRVFPRKNLNAAKITGYRFLSRARHLKQQLVRI